MQNLSVTPARRNVLEECKNRLSQSSESWKSRIREDPDLKKLGAASRTRRERQPVPHTSRSAVIAIDKGLDRFYQSSASVSPPSKIVHISTSDLDGVTSSAPRLVGPVKPGARGRTRSQAAQKLLQFSSPGDVSAPITPIDYRVKLCEDDSDDDGSGIAISAKRGLQSKLDYTAVQLKKREVKSPYPNVMLIRIKGEKRPDVRLVAPRFKSITNYGVFVLVTPKKVFVYNGIYSSLLERTKANIFTTSICSKNGELGCHAKAVENVNEGKGAEFWKILGGEGPEEIQDDNSKNSLLEGSEPFELTIAKLNIIFEVLADYTICTVSTGVTPNFSVFRSDANFIFDFGSEIYVWAGRSADRNGFQRAVIYAEELRQQKAPHITEGELLFGDDFSQRRPDWCHSMKLMQGLGDCLFCDKFVDWKQFIAKPSGKWETPAKKVIILSADEEEEAAEELATSLVAYTPDAAVLFLEDSEIRRGAENVFSENLHYYLLEGENKLTELKSLNLLFNTACYIIKWEYRIERSGVRRLDGTPRNHDTGRPRIAYFYWLGSRTTKKEQGLCALALRNFDRERQPHERIVQGYEPFAFLSLFNGTLAVVGNETRVFLVHSSADPSECWLEELPSPIVFRSHASYVIVKSKVTAWYGGQCSTKDRESATLLANNLLKIEHPYLEGIEKDVGIVEMDESEGSLGFPVVRAKKWISAPRLIRLFDIDGEDLSYAQWDATAPFSFCQSDLRNTMIVDQGSAMWLWTEDVASTYSLRVAHHYWGNRPGFAKVICKSKEPVEFKALFPTWEAFAEEIDENTTSKDVLKRTDPVDVETLLRERNQKWPLDKLVSRDLPVGIDLKRLEQYLSDSEFEETFQMSRSAFYSLASWKQIQLRKTNNLF